MSLSWYISHPRRLIWVVANGDIQPHDFARLFESVDAAKASPYRKVFDVTGLTTEFTPDMIGTFASWVRQREAERKVGPIAIIAGSPQTHDQATHFAKQARGLRLIQVFQQRDEARRWLDGFPAPEDLRPINGPATTTD
jgi:hypothetical protein